MEMNPYPAIFVCVAEVFIIISVGAIDGIVVAVIIEKLDATVADDDILVIAEVDAATLAARFIGHFQNSHRSRGRRNRRSHGNGGMAI